MSGKGGSGSTLAIFGYVIIFLAGGFGLFFFINKNMFPERDTLLALCGGALFVGFIVHWIGRGIMSRSGARWE